MVFPACGNRPRRTAARPRSHASHKTRTPPGVAQSIAQHAPWRAAQGLASTMGLGETGNYRKEAPRRQAPWPWPDAAPRLAGNVDKLLIIYNFRLFRGPTIHNNRHA